MPKILVGASCRREAVVLEQHLKTLQWQKLPSDVTLYICHVDDFTPEQRDVGRALLEAHNSEILSGVEQVAILDFDDRPHETHHWQLSAFERVAQNKQLLFDKAVREGYDYVWICDTDLILDRTTLWSMYYANAPVVAAVYWTRWQADQKDAQPQVWMQHPYQLTGRGVDYTELRRSLIDKQLVRVWGLGACMLVATSVLERGVRYWPLLPELVQAGGMMAGEDRTFCVLCERAHVEMYADAWPDVYHVYRPADEQHMDNHVHEFKVTYEQAALYPTYGDYVSMQAVPLEDAHLTDPVIIRGRVGQLRLLPELEAAVLSMQQGDSRLLRLNYPADYELARTFGDGPPCQYAGHSKVVEFTLVDHKPNSVAPVLRGDVIHIAGCGPIDTFRYTAEQNAHYRSANANT